MFFYITQVCLLFFTSPWTDFTLKQLFSKYVLLSFSIDLVSTLSFCVFSSNIKVYNAINIKIDAATWRRLIPCLPNMNAFPAQTNMNILYSDYLQMWCYFRMCWLFSEPSGIVSIALRENARKLLQLLALVLYARSCSTYEMHHICTYTLNVLVQCTSKYYACFVNWFHKHWLFQMWICMTSYRDNSHWI